MSASERQGRVLRIGAGASYAGDRVEPATELAKHAQLDYLVRSRTARAGFAENYVGLPFDFWDQSA